jgi:SOS response regulatory protein OraA/RecX
MLQHELRQKGISPHIIAEVAEGVDDQGSAYRAAQKKASKSTSSDYYSFRRKFSVFLRRRGFDYDIIQQTVNQLWQELGEGKNA